LAALHILRHDPDATLAVMPSDHAIGPAAVFADAIRQAAEFVDREPERMITFGIRPTYPAESFGYIERGAPLGATCSASIPGATGSASVLSARLSRNEIQPAVASGMGEATEAPLYEVARFREKPPAAVAREYLAAGNVFWNSGIFVWKARTILAALGEYQPEMVAHLRAIDAAAETPNYRSVFEREFAAIRGISIDYAVLEKSPHVAMIEAPFSWDDVGSWQAMARLRGVDGEGNTVSGKHLGVNTTDTIIRATGEHLIATLGLREMIVVHTPDATLVANRHDEEAVRRIVKLLEERGWTEFL
jgi:mannose-1-phosphate guanylyltransferase